MRVLCVQYERGRNEHFLSLYIVKAILRAHKPCLMIKKFEHEHTYIVNAINLRCTHTVSLIFSCCCFVCLFRIKTVKLPQFGKYNEKKNKKWELVGFNTMDHLVSPRIKTHSFFYVYY